MIGTADLLDTNLHHASTHASTAADRPRPQVTDAPLSCDSLHPLRPCQDSSPSRSSRPTNLNLSPSDVSSANNAAPHQDDSTPPTSAISSQVDVPLIESPTSMVTQEKTQDDRGTAESEGSQEPQSGSTSQSPPPNTTSGAKRTASGQVKRISVNGLADVVSHSNGVHHSRTSGLISHGTNGNVLELSQQLRTKLKYAMIKVQNGWQSRSLDEVESLASQSPRSTVSGFQRFNDPTVPSPRTVMSRKYQQESSESDSSDSTVALENRGLVNMVGSPPVPVPSRRALAPPVDIMPASRRRPPPNAAYHTANGHQVPARQMHSSRPSTSQRTPSQNAAMEADAVEILLFMASPNNSGHNPPSQTSPDPSLRSAPTLPSPLRTQFSQTSVTSPKKVTFSEAGSTDVSFDKSALIDRILDELSDDGDDGLEQALRLAEKGKTATTVST
ncbi:uncharacterized protein Z518_04359 [Rhinocladiella mackenziei CBS 650.93]|uniref:Uncharacterized protein n=1 Tax=Rhinocladiella mackenziei CBS 650.93 TaxID=1442369 RepID=A0A0D2H7K9_9EURO|nr:uncharacterized protein Z518_04359 [Rhinocladiella mackenziei CBS 650.93]KIX06383.1 hypothetical protein Z518_04359 [Rhinocladiella mackenziei CBS 650.93]